MLPPIFRATTTGAWWRPAPMAQGVSKRSWLRLFGVLAVLLLPCGHVSAQLMVHPTRIVLEKDQRSAQLEIINNSNEPGTYRITLVNRRMDENGGFSMAETPAPGEQFADGMLRYSPRRVILAPGASQVIRIMTRKPADLATGEYRSHLLFAKQADPAGPNSVETADDKSGTIGVALTALIGISIPVIVREGDTAATVSLSNLALSKPSAGQPLVVSLDMQRSGNQSVYGDLTVSFAPAGEAAHEIIGKASGVAVYTPNALRHVKLPLTSPVGMVLANGTLTASYRERPEHGGALLAEASLSLP